MNNYIIQHRLHTLAQSYVDLRHKHASFTFENVNFSHWDFNFADGHKTAYWLLEEKINAKNFNAAISQFNKKIIIIISQISFLSQCYSEYLNEPYLVCKEGSDIAFFRYTKRTTGVPLAFDENSLKGLQVLYDKKEINDEFFYYWNDMLNVTGYSAKLLLMCSALEALAKSPLNTHGKKGKFMFLAEILGEELKNKIWQQNKGIRHRLTHGEYFDENTDKENYLKEVYGRVIGYFNDTVFKENFIRHVTNPQRHPDGNKEGGHYFLKRDEHSPEFHLKNLVEGCDEGFAECLEQFDLMDFQKDY